MLSYKALEEAEHKLKPGPKSRPRRLWTSSMLAMEVGQHGAHFGGDVWPAWCGKIMREEVQERPGQARDAVHASGLEG